MNVKDVEILLVDDNPDDAELALRTLKKIGFEKNVLHLADGVKALDFILCQGEYEGRDQQYLPKLILIDIKMPRVGGLEVLKILKEKEETRVLPVVVMTSSNEESEIRQSYQMGANSFIVKPVDFHAFSKMITSVAQYWLTTNRPV